jgi:hypothetical protein
MRGAQHSYRFDPRAQRELSVLDLKNFGPPRYPNGVKNQVRSSDPLGRTGPPTCILLGMYVMLP